MTTQPDSLAVRVFEVAIRADPEVAVGPGEIDDPGRNRIPARRRHDRHLRLPHENFLQIAFARWPAMLDDDTAAGKSCGSEASTVLRDFTPPAELAMVMSLVFLLREISHRSAAAPRAVATRRYGSSDATVAHAATTCGTGW
jgi:hypothetical protein